MVYINKKTKRLSIYLRLCNKVASLRSKNKVTAYFSSEKLLLLAFASDILWVLIIKTINKYQ